MHIISFRSVLAFAVVSLLALTANSAILVTNPITGTNPNSSNPYTAGQTVSSNITFSGISRGTGITGSDANNRYNANSWNTPSFDSTAYFEFTISPGSGYGIDFTNFVYSGQASGTGATSFAFRSSLDSFAANLGTPTSSGATISLGASLYQNVTSAVSFRLYGWGASGSGGTFSVNDFTFNGEISAIPEPSTYAVIVSAGVFGCVVARRRRVSI